MLRLRTSVGAVAVPVFFALVLALPVHALEAASCGDSTPGDIYVPTPVPEGQRPPLLSQTVAHATRSAVYVFGDFQQGDRYTLHAVSTPNVGCTIDTCVFVPDFNVVWYTGGGGALAHDEKPGDTEFNDAKTVPNGAAFAYVYLRFGPNVDTTDGLGARFRLAWDC